MWHSIGQPHKQWFWWSHVNLFIIHLLCLEEMPLHSGQHRSNLISGWDSPTVLLCEHSVWSWTLLQPQVWSSLEKTQRVIISCWNDVHSNSDCKDPSVQLLPVQSYIRFLKVLTMPCTGPWSNAGRKGTDCDTSDTPEVSLFLR